ncbi:hypothetical protein DFH08DRAFT_442667 [Mycena albidolilacea]|uniref:Uncharacterized protein n=1 Tax=Mycena albidolilacea TaxID=1033008 RepID=A0AAD7AHM4_9AGAR|nr:hypothetical protein DFH08DRAFT_442667 [Mycena albidolilacea]
MYLTGDMYWDQDKNEHYTHGKRKYVHVNPKVFSKTIIDDGADAPAGNNTGYKHRDPTRPCHKCWSRYARPYAGALVYAPDTPGTGSGHHLDSTTFRRPLPRLYAPPGRAFLSPAPGLPACATAPVSASYPRPAPVSVYAPGDVRMGGVPCWRCGGRGTWSFLVFDSVPCVVCRGVGRVFR